MKMTIRFLGAASAFVLGAVLVTASAWAQPAATNGDAKKVLNIAFANAETTFDPVKTSDLYSRAVAAHIFEAPGITDDTTVRIPSENSALYTTRTD